MKKSILTLAAIVVLYGLSLAQVRNAPASPGATLTQRVGLTDVTIEYSRPSMKGRKIMGDLVPFNEVWRTGANAATKITFSEDVTLGGKELKKGSYAILTKPGQTSWEVMAFEYKSGDFGSYLGEGVTPVAKFTVNPAELPFDVETFTIGVNNLKNDKADIILYWEKTLISIPLGVYTDKQTIASIEATMAGPSNNDYFQAASYYHDSGKDLNKALEYINKATASGEAPYWQMRRKALILADLGKMKEAIAAAEKSKELAKAAGNNQYVKFNEDSIKEWSAKANKTKSMK